MGDWLEKQVGQGSVEGQYLFTLLDHEDRLSCLKLDLWLGMCTSDRPALLKAAHSVTAQLNGLNFCSWGYRASVWLLHSLAGLAPPPLPLAVRVLQAATGYSLAPNRPLGPLLVALPGLTAGRLSEGI